MADRSAGFVGGGRVASIMLGGLAKAGRVPARVVVSDPNESVLAKLKEAHNSIQTVSDNALAAQQDLVFLAVHPPMMGEVAPGVRDALKPEAIVVSLAPKLTIARLSEMLGGFSRVARTIPNAPSIVGCGYNPIAFGPALNEDEKKELRAFFSPLGDCPEVAEERLEAYALTTAMGPTYLWFQLYELRRLAESFGLSAEEACEGITKMVAGTLKTMTDSGLSPEEVMDLIPVKPLAELEPTVAEAYRAKLSGLFEKIRP